MRMRRIVLGGVLSSALTLGVATGPASAVGPQPDPERYSPVGTAWGYLVSGKASIDTWLDQGHGRAIDVEPWGSGFSVVSVDNNNPAFARSPGGSFSWTTDETAASLASKINVNPGKRLIHLARHTVNGADRFAAVWVDNTGPAAKAWWWYLDQTPADISANASLCDCRLIDLNPLGNGHYDVIMIPNTGVDGLASWWYYGLTELQAFQALADNQARPVDLEPDGSGRFAVLMVRDGLSGSMRTNQSWADLGSVPANMRHVHIRNYVNSSGNSVWLSVDMQN